MTTLHKNNWNNKNHYEIRISDLPGEVREIAKLIGLQPALQLSHTYSGECVYFPKIEAITRAVRDRAIIAEYNGRNIKELAHKFNLSTRGIRMIIKGALRKS